MNTSTTTVLWKNTSNTSLEYFTLRCHENDFTFNGTIVALLGDSPAKITYSVKGDSRWQTKQVRILQERTGRTNRLELTVDENQRWHANDKPVAFADGLFDVDLEISPATNTLPINRLNIAIGESQEIAAVWVRFPSLTMERLKQRYAREGKRCYRYEVPSLDFGAALEIDQSGLIIKYGELWKRIP